MANYENYIGKCGSCEYCLLETGTTGILSSRKHYKCKRGITVKANEDPCRKFRLDKSRTNEIIAKYDR